MAASTPDPISIATEKSILPAAPGKSPDIVTIRHDSSSDEVAIKTEDGEDIIKESDYTPEEYKQLVRKIDRYLLPLMVRVVVRNVYPSPILTLRSVVLLRCATNR